MLNYISMFAHSTKKQIKWSGSVRRTRYLFVIEGFDRSSCVFFSDEKNESNAFTPTGDTIFDDGYSKIANRMSESRACPVDGPTSRLFRRDRITDADHYSSDWTEYLTDIQLIDLEQESLLLLLLLLPLQSSSEWCAPSLVQTRPMGKWCSRR